MAVLEQERISLLSRVQLADVCSTEWRRVHKLIADRVEAGATC